MRSLHSIAQQLRTFHQRTDACPELHDAQLIRNWLTKLKIIGVENTRIFGPNFTPVTGNRYCLDGVIRNNPWEYLDYVVYAHVNSYKNIKELVAEKCPAGSYVRDTYNRYVPPSAAGRAAPVIFILTITQDQRFKHDVFDLQDLFTFPEKG